MPRPALTVKRQAFVEAYVYKTNGNATEAARIAGYKSADPEGRQLLRFPTVRAAIDQLLAERSAAIKAEGIANLQNRIDDMNELRDSLKATKAARAADPAIRRAPGGEYGLQTITYKTIPNADPDKPAITVQEVKIDTGLITSWLNVLKQAPQDLGTWTERKEHTGKDGGPIQLQPVPANLAMLTNEELRTLEHLVGKAADAGVDQG